VNALYRAAWLLIPLALACATGWWLDHAITTATTGLRVTP
jgi:hypothetical protein